MIAFYCFEALPAVVGFAYWRRYRHSMFATFIWYSLAIFLLDLAGEVIEIIEYNDFSNVLYYSYLVIPFEFFYFFYFYRQVLGSSRFRQAPVICGGIYVLSWIFEIVYFSKGTFAFYSFSYTVGNLLLLVLTMLFYITLMASDDILKFRTNIVFWISTGLLVYYLGSFPYYGLFNNIIKNQSLNISYHTIVLILDCAMYLLFAAGLALGKPGNNEPAS